MPRKSFFLSFLWISAIGLIALLLIWQRQDANIQLDLAPAQSSAQPEFEGPPVPNSTQSSLSLTSPRFTGRDKDGKTWTIEATSAERSGTLGQDLVTLSKVTATIDSGEIEPITFKANAGEFVNADKELSLTGNVMVNGYGLILETPILSTDLDTRIITAEKQVTLHGVWDTWKGVLTAPQLTLAPNGPNITLTGGVRGRFVPAKP